MKRCKDYSPDQQLLLPPDLNDWLEEGHLVYFIREVVGELDLSGIYDDYHSPRAGSYSARSVRSTTPSSVSAPTCQSSASCFWKVTSRSVTIENLA